MKATNIIILCLSACLLSACVKRSEEYIKIVNKSERDIVYQCFSAKHFTEQISSYICKDIARTILKDSSVLYPCTDPSGWKADFNLNPYQIFLIMDDENYSKYMLEPCDTLLKYVPILHSWQVTYEDMEQMNWTLVYPPEEEDSEPSSF